MKTCRLFAATLLTALSSLLGMSPSQALPNQEVRTYYITDAVGSPVIATDTNANVTWSEDYLPYGERRYQQARAGNNDRWFTGAAQNADSGLVSLGNRYYDPALGRFLSIDPAGVAGGNPFSVNRYVYANNNPYRYVDPDGLETVAIFMVRGVEHMPTEAHSYLLYWDTEDSSKQYIFRAGPDKDALGGKEVSSAKAVLNLPTANVSGSGYVSLRAQNDKRRKSPENKKGGSLADVDVAHTDFDDARKLMDNFAEEINKAEIPYKAQGPNSNSAAAKAFEKLTGRPPDPKASMHIRGLDETLSNLPQSVAAQ